MGLLTLHSFTTTYRGGVAMETRGKFTKLAAKLAVHKERLAIWAVGILANNFFVYAFDFVLYPYVIWKFGLLWGSAIMFPASFTVCWLMLVFYDWAKKDWIAIETIKELKEYGGQNKAVNFLSRVLKMSDPAAVVILSVWKDPFITIAYMRKGAHQYNGLTWRDWKVFIASVFISNIYWALMAFGGIQLIKKIWELLN